MSGPYLVVIDQGSQSTKVVVFDADGAPVCEGREPLRPSHMPSPGVVEHPDDDLWDSLCAATRAAMHAFHGRPEEIAGVGLCTIRFCRAMLRADGSLASPVLSWMDAWLTPDLSAAGPARAGHDTARPADHPGAGAATRFRPRRHPALRPVRGL